MIKYLYIIIIISYISLSKKEKNIEKLDDGNYKKATLLMTNGNKHFYNEITRDDKLFIGKSHISSTLDTFDLSELNKIKVKSGNHAIVGGIVGAGLSYLVGAQLLPLVTKRKLPKPGIFIFGGLAVGFAVGIQFPVYTVYKNDFNQLDVGFILNQRHLGVGLTYIIN